MLIMKIICFFTKVDQRCSYLNTSSGNIMNCFKPGYFSTYISWFIITHLLNLFNENQGMREIGWIFVQFGLEGIPECSSDRVLDFLLYAVMGKKGDWWNFHNHISHIKKKHLGYWGEGCLLQHMITCKTYYGINNHVLFFKDLDHGMIIYHLIFASHGFVFMHSAFFFPTKDFTFKFIIKLHTAVTAHEILFIYRGV